MSGSVSRRAFVSAASAAALAVGARAVRAGRESKADRPALVAITLDLEMSRHYPTWEQMHWDYEKGNLDADTKRYARAAGRRVAERGGRIHYFVVGQVFEQESVQWLVELQKEGHKLGNHTYDHVNVRAADPSEIQFRFQRAPWLLEGRAPAKAIEHNVRLCTQAMKHRLGISPAGFRTPGGFHDGLRDRPDVRKMLKAQGFSWISSLYPPHPTTKPNQRPDARTIAGIAAAQALAQPFAYEDGLVEVPMSPVSDVVAMRTGRWPLDDFLAAVRAAVEWTIERGAVFDFLAHPSCLNVTDPEFRSIDLLCDLVESSKGRARLATLDELAARASA